MEYTSILIEPTQNLTMAIIDLLENRTHQVKIVAEITTPQLAAGSSIFYNNKLYRILHAVLIATNTFLYVVTSAVDMLTDD